MDEPRYTGVRGMYEPDMARDLPVFIGWRVLRTCYTVLANKEQFVQFRLYDDIPPDQLIRTVNAMSLEMKVNAAIPLSHCTL